MFKRLILCLVLLPSAAFAQNKVYDASRIVLASGATFDLTSTVLTKGRESNPTLTQVPVAQVAIVGGLTILSDRLGEQLKKAGHPKAAAVINFVAGSAHFGAGVWNVRLKGSAPASYTAACRLP